MVLCVLIAAGVVGGWIAVHLDQPAILGEIAAGALLGLFFYRGIPFWEPHELMLEMFGQVGLSALLFTVGLEIRMRDLVAVGPASVGVASLGVVTPFVMAYATARLFGLSPLVSMFLGASLTATSVGISAKVLTELGIVGSRGGKIILNAAVFDDVLGLFVLTLVSGVAYGESVTPYTVGMLSAKIVVFFSVALFIVRPLISHLMAFMERTYGDNGTAMTSFSFLMLLSFGAALAGLDVIVGAFTAGLCLSESAVRNHISASLRPFISVFASLFFVVIGTRMDLSLLNPFPAGNLSILSLSAALLVCAVVGKLISGLAIAFDTENRLIVGAGMIPRGEVGLICGNIGLVCGALSEDIFSSLLLVVMFTTFIGPVLLRVIVPRKLRYYPRIPVDTGDENGA